MLSLNNSKRDHERYIKQRPQPGPFTILHAWLFCLNDSTAHLQPCPKQIGQERKEISKQVNYGNEEEESEANG